VGASKKLQDPLFVLKALKQVLIDSLDKLFDSDFHY
jgi:hypothetical protein